MRRRRPLLVIVVALTAALAACAPAEPDWQAAQSEADAFLSEALGGSGVLGTASGQMGQPTGDSSNGAGITLTFPETTRLDGAEVACFGGGEALISLQVRAGSEWTGASIPVTCDGRPILAPFSEPQDRVNAVTVDGRLERGGGAVFAAVVTGEVG